MKNKRNASAVFFGIDFQVNAAIVLMLDYIEELSSLKLEGEEDIELKLNDNTSVLAQAKAVVQSSSDFSNVRKNLKKALCTLSESALRNNARKLIFITNSPNPLKDEDSKSVFYGHSRRPFSTLPPSAQKIIQEYLAAIALPLDTEKFAIHVLPFETDDDKERLKVVRSCVDEFLGSLDIALHPGIGRRLLDIWSQDIFKNGTQRDVSLTLNKKSIIWPLVVLVTDNPEFQQDFFSECDIGDYSEIYKLYQELIDSRCEKMDFFTRVLYDFNIFKKEKQNSKKVMEFVNQTWEKYKDEFLVDGLDSETCKAMIKIILYTIVSRRILIERVKQRVRL